MIQLPTNHKVLLDLGFLAFVVLLLRSHDPSVRDTSLSSEFGKSIQFNKLQSVSKLSLSLRHSGCILTSETA